MTRNLLPKSWMYRLQWIWDRTSNTWTLKVPFWYKIKWKLAEFFLGIAKKLGKSAKIEIYQEIDVESPEAQILFQDTYNQEMIDWPIELAKRINARNERNHS